MWLLNLSILDQDSEANMGKIVLEYSSLVTDTFNCELDHDLFRRSLLPYFKPMLLSTNRMNAFKDIWDIAIQYMHVRPNTLRVCWKKRLLIPFVRHSHPQMTLDTFGGPAYPAHWSPLRALSVCPWAAMRKPVPLGVLISKSPPPPLDGAGLWLIMVSQACPTG